MKLKSYLNFMVINKNFAKRILMLCLVAITFISTALKCKQEDWLIELLPGLEGKKVFADITPNKTIIKVGDTLTIEVNVKPSDLNLENFNQFKSVQMAGYRLYKKKITPI